MKLKTLFFIVVGLVSVLFQLYNLKSFLDIICTVGSILLILLLFFIYKKKKYINDTYFYNLFYLLSLSIEVNNFIIHTNLIFLKYISRFISLVLLILNIIYLIKVRRIHFER